MLRFIDSFDHYDNIGITRKWNSFSGNIVISTTGGRNGTQSLRIVQQNSSILKTLDPQPTWIVGFAANFSSLSAGSDTTAFLQLLSSGSVQIQLRLNSDGTITLVRGNGGVLAGGTSVNSISTGTYYFFEFKCTISTSIAAGSCQLNVNGVNWITAATGESTQSTTSATANGFRIGHPNPTSFSSFDVDDLYICDATGSVNNTFLGDVMVTPLYPNAVGASSQWTPTGSANNYANVNDHPGDTETTFNQTNAAGQIDLYELDNLTATPLSIKGVQWVGKLLKTDASSYVVNRAIRSGGVNYFGAASNTPNTSWVFYTEVLETDPATGAAWTPSGVNALQAGVKLVSVV